MRILQTHSDYIEFEPIEKEISQAEETEKKKYRYEDILVLFTCVEEGDNEDVGKNAIDDVKEFLEKLKSNKIIIYPFAHLSRNLAKPNVALKIIKEMESYAKKLAIETYRAPFGWNKQLSVKTKAHPLAEQSRVYTVTEREKEIVSKSLKEEEKVKSTWYILEPNGKLTPVEEFNFKKCENLEKFAKYEMQKRRAVDKIPPHVTLMKKLEIADYESGSDPGNLKFYPKGRLIKSLLEEWVTKKTIKFGAMEVETPIMYDFEHPALKDYLDRFPARQYIVESAKKKFFLRFSACFGQFLMNSNMTISYKNLPMRTYELTRYSFRLEKAGELVGLKRLRSFTMPDMHTLCKDLEQAKREYVNQFKLCMECMSDLGFEIKDYETAIRFTEDFWKKNKDFILSLVKLVNKPVLIEMWSFRYAYFDPKYEFNIVDALDKASALSTVQIDYENAERYGIQFIDENNKKNYPIILHCSPSGGIERCMYALLEKVYLDSQKGKNPSLPLWLSPTQVRICPISDSYLRHSEKIADQIEKENIRVDVDDKENTVQKKIRDAELDWVPLIIVVGEKELKSGKLAVRIRETRKIERMTIKQVIDKVHKKTYGMPFKSLNLPKHLSKRPTFS